MGKLAAPIGSVFGIGPSHSEYFTPQQSRKARYSAFAEQNPDEIDGIKGSKIASEQVQNDPLQSGLFGKNGLQSRLGAEEQDLASRGFQLNEQDHEAYGQASGDIARQFGQQDQDITKSLAKRGLASGASGAAGAAFSGAAGNKNEMLAQAQTSIAQKRMADTNTRLQQSRTMMGNLGQNAAGLKQSQFERQLAGRKMKAAELMDDVKNETGANIENRASQQDRTGAKNKNLGDAVSEGGYSGVKSGVSSMIGGGMGAMFSDEQLKTNVSDGAPKVRSFLDSIGSGEDASALSDELHGKPNYETEEKSGGGGDMMGSIMKMAPMAMSMFSDENTKCEIEPGGDEIRSFLDSISPNHYEYKDDVKGSLLGGAGEYVSPMAQELEQSELGANMVQDTPEGKVVDYGKGFGTIVAAQADLNSRLKRLEGGR